MTRPIFFVAHPVGGDVAGNLARTFRWLRWLTETHPYRIYTVPWVAEVMTFDDANPSERAASIERNRAIIGRCDGIVLVGGRISTGMSIELAAAQAHQLDVLDLTYLGEEPPR